MMEPWACTTSSARGIAAHVDQEVDDALVRGAVHELHVRRTHRERIPASILRVYLPVEARERSEARRRSADRHVLPRTRIHTLIYGTLDGSDVHEEPCLRYASCRGHREPAVL